MSDSRDSRSSTPGRARGRSSVPDPPAESFQRPAAPRTRTDKTPPPADRWSAVPAPTRRSGPHRASNDAPPLTFSELVRDVARELWRSGILPVAAGALSFFLAVVIFHAIYCFSSLPPDIERRVGQLGRRETHLNVEWVGARYGLYSALRCPGWEAASFRLRTPEHGQEPAQDFILCCSATAEPQCQLKP